MPTYGPSKQRDMIRSVLPSKSRKGARDDLNNARRAARSEARSRMSVYRGYVRDIDEIEHDIALDDYPTERIGEIVDNRREADKLGPLFRWAPAQVEHLPQHERLDAMRALIGNTPMGRHALGHLKFEDAFYVEDPTSYRYGNAAWAARRAEYAEARRRNAELLREDLRFVVETNGALSRFNEPYRASWVHRWVYDDKGRRTATVCERYEGRPLLGLHDIEDFIAAHGGPRRGELPFVRESNLNKYAREFVEKVRDERI